jgi:hypothetical protein
MDLFANELAGLRRRCLALAFVSTGAFERSFFRHVASLDRQGGNADATRQ